MKQTLRLGFLVFLVVAAIVGLPSAATATWCAAPVNPPPDPPDDPDPRCCPECKCTGSPAYLGIGAYTSSVTDFEIKSAAGFPLVASRHYVSSHVVDGPMGVGWMPSVVSRLSYTTYMLAAGVYQKRAYVILPDGTRIRFIENSNGTFTADQGRYDTLIKNSGGSFDLTLQHTRSQIHFGGTGYATMITDDYGNQVSITNGPTGMKPNKIQDLAGSGRYLTITWGADGRIATIGDSTGRLVQYAYDGQGALHTVTNALNQVTTYDYDQGRFGPLLSHITDHWNREVASATYDPQTDLVLSYADEGEVYTLAYGYLGVPNQVGKHPASLPAGYFRTYRFDINNGLITDNFNLADANQHFDYYPDGSIKQITDRVLVKTFYEYDVNGNVLAVTRNYQGSSGPKERFEYAYDATFPSKVISITPKKPNPSNPSQWINDLDWQSWQYSYYPAGDPFAPGALYQIKRQGTFGALITYVYDSRGRVTQSYPATGTTAATDYAYDAAGNLTTVTLPLNNNATRPVITYGYDALGRLTSMTDPLGKVTSYTYDVLDRQTSMTLPAVTGTTGSFTTTYTYDSFDAASGLLFTLTTDPNNVVTSLGFNAFGQLVKAVDGLQKSTSYTYLRGLVASATDANGYTTTYSYDAADRLTQTKFPDLSTETYVWTRDGLINGVTRNAHNVFYQYDALKRLTNRWTTDVAFKSMLYAYTGQKLTQVTDTFDANTSETTTLGYDTLLRLNKITDAMTVNGVQTTRGIIDYTWTANDKPLTYKVEGSPDVTATYAYYNDNSLKQITWSAMTSPNVFTFAYDLAGRRTNLTFPTGQKRDYTYDEQGRVLTLVNRTTQILPAGNLATYSYAYDKNQATGLYDRKGQRVGMTAIVPALTSYDGLTKYEYDLDYQLTKRTFPSGTSSTWAYDDVGNHVGSGYTYQTISPNTKNWQRQTGAPGQTFTYDNRGNVATQTGLLSETFTYDWLNRLSSVSGSVNASYTYDYQGRRTTKTVGGSTATYLYDNLSIVQEKSGSTVTADFLSGPGIDEPLAMKRGSSVYYYMVDALGSVSLVTDTVNNAGTTVQDKYKWDAWGERVGVTTDLVPNVFGYTGREIGDIKDHFYRARYYAPSTGRFYEEDPLVTAIPMASTLGLKAPRGRTAYYNYANNSPLKYVDPSGLDAGGANQGNTTCIYNCGQTYFLNLLKCNQTFLQASGFCTFALGVCLRTVPPLICGLIFAGCEAGAYGIYVTCTTQAGRDYYKCVKGCPCQ